jgi:hypothetical protein
MSQSTPHPHLEAKAKRCLGKLSKSFPDRTVDALLDALEGADATYLTLNGKTGREAIPTLRLNIEQVYAELAAMDPAGNAYNATEARLTDECYQAATAITQAIYHLVRTSSKISRNDRFMFDTIDLGLGDSFQHHDALEGTHQAQHAERSLCITFPNHNDPRAVLDFLKDNMRPLRNAAKQYYYGDLLGQPPSGWAH